MPINEEVARSLGNKVRVRVCGLLWEAEGMLMVNHAGLYGHDFWSPPGGGLNFGESPAEALIREFGEECGLEVEPGPFLFTCSIRKPPLHAIELFFAVRRTGGKLAVGTDPERGEGQIISAVEFISPARLAELPADRKHPLLSRLPESTDLMDLKGFFDLT